MNQPRAKPADGRPHRRTAVTVVALLTLATVWSWLGLTVLRLGPSAWDDALYCDRAALPAAMWELRNRYVHVWSLRGFFALFDVRSTAAIAYGIAVAVGISWATFFLAQRLTTTLGAVVAAAIVVLHPAILPFVTVPFVDPPMVLWSALALLLGLLGVEHDDRRVTTAAVVASGVAGYFAVEAKETGLTVLPAVVLVLASSRTALRTRAAAWVGGIVIGWLVLRACDLAFLPDAKWLPSDWSGYFGSDPTRQAGAGESGARGGSRMGRDFVGQLLEPSFMAFTLLGIAGLVHGLRRELRVRALAVWLGTSLLFSTWVAWRARTIDAEPRYCAVMAVPLAVLGAYWLIEAVRRAPPDRWRQARWVVLACTLVLLAPVMGWMQELTGAVTQRTPRAVHFGLPLAAATLCMVPYLGVGRRVTAGALTLALTLGVIASTRDALQHVSSARRGMLPWTALAHQMDDAHASIARWHAPRSLPELRLERRLRVLSRREPEAIAVRSIKRLEDARPNEWVLTSDAQRSTLEASGWRPIAAGRVKKKSWIAYRPP